MFVRPHLVFVEQTFASLEYFCLPGIATLGWVSWIYSPTYTRLMSLASSVSKKFWRMVLTANRNRPQFRQTWKACSKSTSICPGQSGNLLCSKVRLTTEWRSSACRDSTVRCFRWTSLFSCFSRFAIARSLLGLSAQAMMLPCAVTVRVALQKTLHKTPYYSTVTYEPLLLRKAESHSKVI